jgi:hypothetical protein
VDSPPARPVRHLRWYIAVLLCLSTELNYLDRQTLSVLATTIQKDLGLTSVDYCRHPTRTHIGVVMYSRWLACPCAATHLPPEWAESRPRRRPEAPR